MINQLIIIVASLLFLSLVFIPMEKVFPAKGNQKVFRKGWRLDLCFFIGQYTFWSFVVMISLDYFDDTLISIVPSTFQNMIQAQPFWLQVIEVLVFSDLFIYWAHRLQHKFDFLWRFHKVHHSAEHLDWLAAHREHPLDSIYTIGIINLPAVLMGFPLETIGGIIAFRGIWAIYIHSNVRISFGVIKYLIGAPELHHWHHDKERDRGNYANISPLMDVIFGTYTCPDKEPKEFGLKSKSPKTYIGQLLEPLLPRKVSKKFKF